MLVVDRDLRSARQVAARLGPHALAQQADVSRPSDAHPMIEVVEARLGALDILVNNAGVSHLPMPTAEVGEDDFYRIVAVSMKAIYLAVRQVVPRFKARRRGVILSITSTAGVSPRPRLSWYNASKGWVITATRALAVELAPFGIRVVALNPGGR